MELLRLTAEDSLERLFDVARLQSTGLDEAQRIIRRKLLALLLGDRPQVYEIALVANQHDHNVAIRMIPELFQPPCHILERLVLADVVYK